jgi:hypothetical protein
MSRNVGPAFSLPLKAGLPSRMKSGDRRRVYRARGAREAGDALTGEAEITRPLPRPTCSAHGLDSRALMWAIDHPAWPLAHQ